MVIFSLLKKVVKKIGIEQDLDLDSRVRIRHLATSPRNCLWHLEAKKGYLLMQAGSIDSQTNRPKNLELDDLRNNRNQRGRS